TTTAEKNLTQNEAVDLAAAGGGIVLGADDSSGAAIVQHVNQVAALFNFNLLTGVYEAPASNFHVGGALFNAPNAITAPQLTSSTGSYLDLPHGQQPDGLYFSTAIFSASTFPIGGFGSPPLSDETFNGVDYPEVDHLVTASFPGAGIDQRPVLT